MVHVTKLFPSADGKNFQAFGRVLSGTLEAGQRVKVCLLFSSLRPTSPSFWFFFSYTHTPVGCGGGGGGDGGGGGGDGGGCGG